MNVVINGKAVELLEDESVTSFLQRQGFDPQAVVVEHNEQVVPMMRFAETRLSDGDVLEVLHFVGGG